MQPVPPRLRQGNAIDVSLDDSIPGGKPTVTNAVTIDVPPDNPVIRHPNSCGLCNLSMTVVARCCCQIGRIPKAAQSETGAGDARAL